MHVFLVIIIPIISLTYFTTVAFIVCFSKGRANKNITRVVIDPTLETKGMPTMTSLCSESN
jgi:hypothetical protein